MRTGRPKHPLILTEEERERLESLAHRARVVLGCAEGLGNDTVARKLRCSVGKWRARCTTSRGPERRAPSAMPRLSRL